MEIINGGGTMFKEIYIVMKGNLIIWDDKAEIVNLYLQLGSLSKSYKVY